MSLIRLYFYISAYFLLINCTKWNADELSEVFIKSSRNFLIDPESLINDSHFIEKISNKYFNNTSLLTQLNTTIFVISKISDEYSNDQDLFGKKLIEKIYSRKVDMASNFVIIFISNENIWMFYPTEEVLKYLNWSDLEALRCLIQKIKFKNLNNILKNFLKNLVNILIPKDNIYQNFTSNKLRIDRDGKYMLINELLFTLLYTAIFTGIILLFMFRNNIFKKQINNLNIIRVDKNCSICLEEIEEGAQGNFLTYEEICRKKLDKNKYIAVLNCGHIFHSNCIFLWEEQSKNQGNIFLKCPKCREISLSTYNITRNSDTTNFNYFTIEQYFRNLHTNLLFSNVVINRNLTLLERQLVNRQQLQQIENSLNIFYNSLQHLRNPQRIINYRINFN